jgi:hypothetical protein
VARPSAKALLKSPCPAEAKLSVPLANALSKWPGINVWPKARPAPALALAARSDRKIPHPGVGGCGAFLEQRRPVQGDRYVIEIERNLKKRQ